MSNATLAPWDKAKFGQGPSWGVVSSLFKINFAENSKPPN